MQLKTIIKSLIEEFSNVLGSFKTKGSFTRNFSYLFSARVITILLSFMITPILTRLYSPSAYGNFSLFNAVVMNFTILCCLAYDNALVIVKGERKFYNLLTVCLLLSLIFTILLSVGLNISNWLPSTHQLFAMPKAFEENNLMILMICGAFIYSNAQILAKWNVRRDKFKLASSLWLVNQALNRAGALLLGFFYNAPIYGLILSELAGRLSSIILNLKFNLIKEWESFKTEISFKRMKKVVRSLNSYPKFILPNRYIVILIEQVPIFLLTLYFGTEVLGNFSLAISIINAPVLLIGNTMSPVFLKKASDLRNNKVVLNNFIFKVSYLLTIIVVPIYVILIFFSDRIFPFFFGDDWIIAGSVASIVAFYTIVQLYQIFALPLFQIFKKENQVLSINVTQLVTLLIFCIPGIVLNNYLLLLAGYGLVKYSFGWLQIIKSIKPINGNLTRLICTITLIMLAALLLNYFLDL